jgi:hypothetical protein
MPAASPLVSRAVAMGKMTHHQFIRSVGFLAHSGPPDLEPHHQGKKNCAPKAGSANGSRHWLKPGNGHPDIVMTWVAAESAWASTKPDKGNRLAWSVEHLSRAGWEYVGPVKQNG